MECWVSKSGKKDAWSSFLSFFCKYSEKKIWFKKGDIFRPPPPCTGNRSRKSPMGWRANSEVVLVHLNVLPFFIGVKFNAALSTPMVT